MSYRDDNDALRAKLAKSEAELAAAQEKIAKLEGRKTTAKANAFLGAPSKIALEEVFDGELSEAVLEKIVWILRDRYGNLGRIDRLGDTVAWSSAAPQHPLDVLVEKQGGRTRVVIREGLSQTAAGVFGGFLLGLGGGGTAGAIGIGAAFGVAPVALPLVALGWISCVYVGTRGIYKNVVRNREKNAASVMAAIDAVFADVSSAGPTKNVRVAGEEAAEELEVGDDHPAEAAEIEATLT